MRKIQDGYHAQAGLCADGTWFASVLQIHDTDRDFITMDPAGTDRQRMLLPGKTLEDWMAACLNDPVTVVLVAEGDAEPIKLATGLQVYPPAVPAEIVPAPMAVWCEADGNEFLLKLYIDGEVRTIRRDPRLLANLSICLFESTPYIAYQTHAEDRTVIVEVCDTSGSIIYSSPGMGPTIKAAPGGMLLVHEFCSNANIQLSAALIVPGQSLHATTKLAGYDDFNTHPSVVVRDASAFVVWETSPAWGGEHYIASHRNIVLARLELDGGITVAGTERLPIPQTAYKGADSRRHNLPPIYPSLIDSGTESPSVVYRRFRPDRVRSYGWDLFMMSKDSSAWSKPRRISTSYGIHDSGYSVVPRENSLIGFYPACKNNGNSMPHEDHWLEIETFDSDRDLGDFFDPPVMPGEYHIQPSVVDPAGKPEELTGIPGDLELIYGDLHRHSSTSKCMCARDGSPEEVIRFCRDILGTQVLVLTDHHHHSNHTESVWNNLALEQEAAGRVILYGTEPGCGPGHHTIFYANTREEWEKLRCCVLIHFQREEMYRQFRKTFPPDGLPAIRHVHGSGSQSPEAKESFDQELEIAMEVIQCRGSFMVAGDFELSYLFPTDFLNRGARIALLGGTDHTGQPAVNQFGMTAFWTNNQSTKGVWDSIRARCTYALSNGKMALWAEIDGHPFGSSLTSTHAAFEVQVSAGRPLRRIGLIRDGEIIVWLELSDTSWTGTIEDDTPPEGEHWYTIVVQGESVYTIGVASDIDNFAQPWCMAFASPFFLDINR